MDNGQYGTNTHTYDIIYIIYVSILVSTPYVDRLIPYHMINFDEYQYHLIHLMSNELYFTQTPTQK